MELDFAFICDYADTQGKVAALGIGFDTIYAKELPCRHALMCFVTRLRAHRTESGHKTVKVDIIDSEGAEVATTTGDIEFKQPPDNILESTATVAFRFEGLEFQRYGAYSLHLLLDGNEIHRIGLNVSPLPVTD